MAYLRDPAAIYAQSFAAIRAEADLAHLPSALHAAAIRMIHACGMPDLAADIVGDPAVAEAIRNALDSGAPILCDCEMVRAGIIARYLPRSNELLVTLNDPDVPALAQRLGTTRSAAAVELWRDRLSGAIVVIGNAPTALFHLLDILAVGSPSPLRGGDRGGGSADARSLPAAIIASPVGFVGAAESKARLVAEAPAPYLTVTGRRGGSAIASAAFNALSGGEQP
jgi:precorrin-8X/cobalt-precorrin-8 methylmutase